MLTTEAKIAHKLGLTPNRISIIGFILALASAVSYAVATPAVALASAFSNFFHAGVWIL